MFNSIYPKIHHYRWWLGIVLVSCLAGFSQFLADRPLFQSMGLGALTIAIILGMLVGNLVFSFFAEHVHEGVDYAKNILLRTGIILYGFRLTFQQIGHVGWIGVLIDMIVVSTTFLLAVWAGQKLFRLDREACMLIGAGSAICGAAAVMATEPVLRAPSHKVTVAVATVVVFGTLSLFLYPHLYPLMGLNEHDFGIYIGSTVHEVAQVVAAGKAVSESTTESAVIVKMIRVMLLVPFLIVLSSWLARQAHRSKNTSEKQTTRIMIPWFAVLFIVASGITSLGILSENILTWLNYLSTFLLSMAMAALGLRTHVSAIKQAGLKPLFLAGMLFFFLVVGGGFLNHWALNLFS